MLNMMCTSRRCPMTSHTISVPVLSSFLQLFLLLQYPQAKCLIYCLTLNPVHGIILMKNARIKKKRNPSLVNKIRRHCIFSCIHRRHVRRFKREQMTSMLSFRRFFNLKVWFLWLFINPYPVYLQTKEFSYQNGVISLFEWCKIPSHLYTLNSL